jgi:hypothetical protein
MKALTIIDMDAGARLGQACHQKIHNLLPNFHDFYVFLACRQDDKNFQTTSTPASVALLLGVQKSKPRNI